MFDSVLPSEIELEIMLTPTSKSHGLYSCPTRLLKCPRHIISAPLATLINNSVKGVFSPPNLSMLRLFQYLRTGTKPNPGTIVLYHFFRSLIDSEKIMYNRLKSFLANIVYFTSLSTVSENSAQPSTKSRVL